jgi:phospholipid/cholesterol/gamma-HCH transport system substrate-binding protein
VNQLNGLLSDARNSLQKVDSVLVEVQAIAGNTREATVDLDALRAEVEASLRKVQHLVNEVNRKWPLARDAEVKLP